MDPIDRHGVASGDSMWLMRAREECALAQFARRGGRRVPWFDLRPANGITFLHAHQKKVCQVSGQWAVRRCQGRLVSRA